MNWSLPLASVFVYRVVLIWGVILPSPPRGHLRMSEDIFCWSQLGKCKNSVADKARDGGKHPVVHRAVYHYKGLSSLKCQ